MAATTIWPWRRVRLAPVSTVRVWLLVVAIAGAAAGLYLGVLGGMAPPDTTIRLPWWSLGLIFLLAEAYPVHLHFRSEAHSLSLGEIGLVLGLLLASPGELLVGQLCGTGLALVVARRQRPLKVAFNLAECALASCFAVLIFHAVSAAGGGRPVAWVGALAAAAAYSLAGVALVSVAIALAEATATARQLPRIAVIAFGGSLASAGLALAAVELLEVDAAALVLLLIPSAICALAFRAYGAERRRHEHVDFLYRSMRAMQGAPELSTALRELLGAARSMLSAEFAEIVLFDADSAGGVLRSTLGPGDEQLVESTELSEAEFVAVRGAFVGETAILLPRGRAPHDLDDYLARLGLDDAIFTVLRRDERISGLLLVGNRAGDVSTFTPDDRTLFETFASHAGVLLENDRVKEQLRYQAYHDALTGLPNRVLFAEKVARALARVDDEGSAPAVLFLDLDDFKTINDSLGHTAGDELLIAVAQRVRSSVRTGDTAARLGGDEFGILLVNTRPGEAEGIAERVVDALRAPFVLQGAGDLSESRLKRHTP